jgi:Zn-dependent peptidase ImmA (M78 family)
VKKDDHTLDKDTERRIRKRAELLLQKAGAMGVFPTPVEDLMAAADLELCREETLDKVYLRGVYEKLPNWVKLAPERIIKKALDKVDGLLHRPSRTIHLDKSLYKQRRNFVGLHEVGHDFLPWQRKTYDLLEDSRDSLDDETKDVFEREANCFSSDVLFQGDSFTEQASDLEWGIWTPIKVTKNYGASIYAGIRRYVVKNEQPCAVIVFNRPTVDDNGDRNMTLRREISSPAFQKRFGKIRWLDAYGEGSFFVSNLPGNRYTRPTPMRLENLNGDHENCVVEAFDTRGKQLFFLIKAVGVPSPTVAF